MGLRRAEIRPAPLPVGSLTWWHKEDDIRDDGLPLAKKKALTPLLSARTKATLPLVVQRII